MWWSYVFLFAVVNFIFCPSNGLQLRSKSSAFDEEPLLLTPILEKGQIMEARKLAKVNPAIGPVTSYSGYFTVNKPCQSNLFFWFFPAKNSWKTAPVVLWLQGGPGGSSLYGLFEEIGPFSYESKLENREYSWNVENNLLFIDQPVGTGFSFSVEDCFDANETQVSEDLYSALTQFFLLFPEISKNRFFIAGESYAGTYIPSIGHKIHQSNEQAKVKINLQGILIGNGYMDQFYQGSQTSEYTEYMYQIGLVDFHGKDRPYKNHLSSQNKLLKSSNQNEDSLGYKCNGADPYNYLNMECSSSFSPAFTKLLRKRKIHKSIHVGNKTFVNLSGDVYDHLNDEKINIKAYVEELLEHYPIVFYNGQLDTVCPYPLLVKFLRALSWSGAEDYERAPRQQWCEGGTPAGYYKSTRNLHEVMVRAAGHMVPHDQPHWAFSLVNSVTSNPPDNPLASLSVCSSV